MVLPNLVIAQGSKEVLLGSDRYQYDPIHYLLGRVELPIASQILEATQEKPYHHFNQQHALNGDVNVNKPLQRIDPDCRRFMRSSFAPT